jgi:serine/threonine-protein kinase
VVSGNGKLKLDQQGRGVTVQSKTVLSPQQTQTLQFTGRYKDSNAAPMVFELGGQTCQTFVSPAPGAPSQPVEVLDNGTVRLGPVPSADTPIPGISINPSGVAVPVPVNTSSAPVSSAPTSTAPAIVDPPGDGDGDGEGPPVQPEPPDHTEPTTEDPISQPPVVIDTFQETTPTGDTTTTTEEPVRPPGTFG